MKTCTLTIRAIFLLPAVIAQIIGVAPKDQNLYVPNSDNKWACLNDPEIILDFKQVNDDYCDCPDGSDEPGTNACPNTSFYCLNEGHVPSYIKGSLVNDGKCDYELCCDGSDEWNTPVDCPNRCAEMYKMHGEELRVKQKSYKIGSDKASEILKAAKELREKLEVELAKENERYDYYDIEMIKNLGDYDLLESEKKGIKDVEDCFQNLKTKAIDSFSAFTGIKQNLDALVSISKGLVDTFNPNLNDAAVATTVDKCKAHYDKYDADYKKEKNLDFLKVKDKITQNFETKPFDVSRENADSILNTLEELLTSTKLMNERIANFEDILKYFIDNYNPNFNDPNVKEAVQAYQDYLSNKASDSVSLEILHELKSEFKKLEKLSRKNKDGQIAHLVEIQDKLPILERLRRRFREFVIVFLGLDREDVHHKRKLALANEKEGFLNDLKKNKKAAGKRVDELSKDLERDLGPDDILRPLEETTIAGKIGEYDYEVNLLKDLRQIGSNNHNVKIGTFNHYELKHIDEENLEWTLYYQDGNRCWNGPKRSGVISITCGESNELLSVSEPEKCEYYFKLKAPIGCKVPGA